MKIGDTVIAVFGNAAHIGSICGEIGYGDGHCFVVNFLDEGVGYMKAEHLAQCAKPAMHVHLDKAGHA